MDQIKESVCWTATAEKCLEQTLTVLAKAEHWAASFFLAVGIDIERQLWKVI